MKKRFQYFFKFGQKIRHGIAISSMDEIEGAIKEEFELNKQKNVGLPENDKECN